MTWHSFELLNYRTGGKYRPYLLKMGHITFEYNTQYLNKSINKLNVFYQKKNFFIDNENSL